MTTVTTARGVAGTPRMRCSVWPNSLIAINEKKAACDTLGKLRAEFPSPRADLREAIGIAGQRGGCR